MKLCLALVSLVWLGAAQAASLSYLVATPTLRSYPYEYGRHATSVITPVQHQYHTQDELGQYAYGYSDPLSTKQEVRSLDGVTRGSYSYRDAEGILQTVDYTADDTGFHVTATNLPKPVQQPHFRTSESSIPDTVPSAASTADTTNTISPDTDTESIASAGAFGNAIYPGSGLRLAESAASHAKHLPNTVRSMELSQPLADTIKMAPSTAIYVSGQPRNAVVAAPLTVAGIPVAKSLLHKVYGFGYPLSKRFIYY